jgi:hypothetical protein
VAAPAVAAEAPLSKLKEEVAVDAESHHDAASRAEAAVAANEGTAGAGRSAAQQEAKAAGARAASPQHDQVDTASLRRAREEWRRRAEDEENASAADAARVMVVELGFGIWRRSGADEDRRQAMEDARAYLARADAASRARVRALLEDLEP